MKCSSEDSSGRSLIVGLRMSSLIACHVAYHCHEQVGDGGCAHVAKRGELVAIDPIEQQNAAAKYLALVNRFERTRRSDLLGMHRGFQKARFEFFHTAIKYNAAAIDEHDVGENVLHLFDLVRSYDDGAFAIEVVVQKRIVELLAIKDVDTERWFVEHQ